jgi:L-seryl-tRNA(Ser) seleniumtransferase
VGSPAFKAGGADVVPPGGFDSRPPPPPPRRRRPAPPAARTVRRRLIRLPAMRPPSVDALARSVRDLGLPHAIAVDIARGAIAGGDPESVRALARAWQGQRLRPVINATGVLLHTNLGRAPAAAPPDSTGEPLPSRYSNLEFDLALGARGSRQGHVGPLIETLTGAEDALVVNNGAAAVLLVLTSLASERAVLVSRGELVEIGGGFRLPEIFEACGARLVEVGTTNRTYRSDYEQAMANDPAAIVQVHRSNFAMTGFTASVAVGELAAIGPPVVSDIGSGLLDARTPWLRDGPPGWLAGEPGARQTLDEGASIVTFSGDKLLGGPQAGIIAGRRALVEACAAHPLARALRPGPLVLDALERVLLAYIERSPERIPFWAMATTPLDELRRRARAVSGQAGTGTPVDLTSTPGGGSAPGSGIASAGVALDGDHWRELLDHDPPVLCRREGKQTLMDLRSVDPADDAVVVAAVCASTAARLAPRA